MKFLSSTVAFYFAASITFIFTFFRAVFFILPQGILENSTGTLLILQFKLFLIFLGYSFLYIIQNSGNQKLLIFAVVVLAIRWAYTVIDKKKILPPEAYPLMAVSLVGLQFFADLSLTYFIFSLLIILVFMLLHTITLRLIATALTFIAALYFLDKYEIIFSILFMLLGLWLVKLTRKTWLTRAEAALALLFLIPLFQIGVAYLPAKFTTDHATRFTDKLALSFCEMPAKNALFAVHPECPMAMFTNQCLHGFIGEYDSQTLQTHSRINILNGNYYGRPEQIVCHGKKIFVGLNEMWANRRYVGPNAAIIDFTTTQPIITRNIGQSDIGNSLLYDPIHDALFMASEWDKRIYRWDFSKNTMNTTIGDHLPNEWYWPPTRRRHDGSRILHHNGYSRNLNTAYAAEWISGRRVHEIDLTALQPKRTLVVNGGASLGATVDDTASRLWVSHLWGVSVFNLKSGALLKKHRLGFMNRPAVFDFNNNLVFIASSLSGRIYVFNRVTMQRVKAIAVGMGPRYLYVSNQTNRLYYGTIAGSYALDLGGME